MSPCCRLCGATTEDGGKPTGLWWAYKSYGDITGTLYDVAETANLRVVAGADEAAASIVVLIGNQSKDPRPASLLLRNLATSRTGMRQCLVRRRLIPNTEANALEAPDSLPEMTVDALNDALMIDVGAVPAYGAVEVTIRGDEPKAGGMERKP